MSHCPSCGRYVGPYEACPYCGAGFTDRIPVRIVKVAAALAATVGLAFLWLVAIKAQVPTVAIGPLGAGMNLAYVRVEGQCTRGPSFDPHTGYLSFWISDDTGELHVVSYRAETQTLIDEGRIPGLGDAVTVAGTLRIREDFRSLTINTPGEVTHTRAPPEPSLIAAIRPEQSHRRVVIHGQVRQVTEPYPGLTLITLRDGTGTIDVALTADLIALSGVTPTVKVGQSVEVAAAVSEYEGTPQLVPASAGDIVPLDEDVPIALQRFAGELARADVGKCVSVQGAVTRADQFSAGVKLSLDDGSGTVTVLLWQDIFDQLNHGMDTRNDLAPGAEIAVEGELSEYRGHLEVIPELAADVHVLAAPNAGMSAMPIDLLTADDVGRSVVLRGTLGPPELFSAGVKYRLSDQTGTIVLLLWDDVYDSIAAKSELIDGARVEIAGEINQYRGDLEIVPRAGGVKLLE